MVLVKNLMPVQMSLAKAVRTFKKVAAISSFFFHVFFFFL